VHQAAAAREAVVFDHFQHAPELQTLNIGGTLIEQSRVLRVHVQTYRARAPDSR